MVMPFLQLKNTEGSGVGRKMIVEFALPVSHCSGKVHQEEEVRAPCDSRSLLMPVITFSHMAKTYFSNTQQISSLLSLDLPSFSLLSLSPHTTHLHKVSLGRSCQQHISMLSSAQH